MPIRLPECLHYPCVALPTMSSSHYFMASRLFKLKLPSSRQNIMSTNFCITVDRSYSACSSYSSAINSYSLKRIRRLDNLAIISTLFYFLRDYRYAKIVEIKGPKGAAAVLALNNSQVNSAKNGWHRHSSSKTAIYRRFTLWCSVLSSSLTNSIG